MKAHTPKRTLTAILVALVLAGGAFLPFVYDGDNTPLGPKEVYLIPCVGESMLPTISEFEIIRVVKRPYSELAVRDIVIYWDTEREVLICHRLIERMGDTWKVAGDNNGISDPGVMTKREYRGVVIKLSPMEKKYLQLALQ